MTFEEQLLKLVTQVCDGLFCHSFGKVREARLKCLDRDTFREGGFFIQTALLKNTLTDG